MRKPTCKIGPVPTKLLGRFSRKLLSDFAVLMKIVQTFIFFCKFHKISIDNSYKIFLAKLDLAGHV